MMLVKRNGKIQPLKSAILNDPEVLVDFLEEVERNSCKSVIEKSALNTQKKHAEINQRVSILQTAI